MADFTLLNPKWNNDKIKEMFNVCDCALDNEDRFYYITNEGKLAYLETKATNKAETIARVFYTLGLLNSDREAKEQIACGIICGSKHIAEITCNDDDDDVDEMKAEAFRVILGSLIELSNEMKNKFRAMSDLLD